MKRPDGTIKGYRVQITNTYLPTLEWLTQQIGVGYISRKTYTGVHGHYKPCGAWATYGEKGRQLLRQLLPFLQIKRAKALEALKCES